MDNKEHNSIFVHFHQPDFMPAGTTYCSVEDLEQHEESSLDNIIVQDLFDYYPDEEIIKFIKVLKNKLKEEGTLHIQGTDIKQLAIAITFDAISIDQSRALLYPFKNNIHTMSEMIQLLQADGFHVSLKKFMNITEYYIVVQKICKL